MRFATPAPLVEADITNQIRDFMEHHGWRPVRMQRTIVPGQFSTCEPGTADFLFLYYLKNGALALWVELKKPKARMQCRCIQNRGTRKRCTACDQKAWQMRERARGGVVWSGVDDIEWFIEQYERAFGWLHSGDRARGQLDLLAGCEA
jgi:hypothetical protein